MSGRRRAFVAGCSALIVVAWLMTGGMGVATAGTPASVDVKRVLVISLPATSWADIKRGNSPNLAKLLADSAVADMVTRAAGRKSSIQGGYTAFGAGGRASAVTPLAPQAFEPSEPYGDSTAGDVYRQRTGVTATTGIVHLGIEALVQENADGLYDPDIGALGDALAKAGIPRAVVANGDGAQPVVDDPLPEYQRSAVNALMTHDGTVPGGSVGDELLTSDPHAPFGVRMDNGTAFRAFDAAWRTGGVVLVEGSDLLRADLASDFLTPEQLGVQKADALRRTDALVGRVLGEVDPRHDAVFVVSPASPRKGPGLAVTGIRAPGVAPGLLRSATSRRTGFVYVIDIAPTILQLLGISPPAKMEGRVMEVRGGVSRDGRVDFLIHANQDAVFRDSKVAAANNIAVILAAVLALACAFVVAQSSRGARATRFLSLAVLGYLFATYVAALLHFGRSASALAYYGFLIAGAIVLAALCSVPRRRHPYLPLGLALAATVALHVADLLSGARLELNTVFGYSATVGIRVSGQGNLTFAQLVAAVLLLAGLVVWRRPGRRAVYAVIVMLGVTLLVMAGPPWGGDFGAAIAGAPAFGLFAWMLLGRTIRVRTVAILGGILVAAGLLVGFADLMRPKDQQTHVGRFFDQVANGGAGDFFLTMRRKLSENMQALTQTRLIWILPIVAVLVVYLWRASNGQVRRVFTEVRVVRQMLLALVVAAVLGYALNDSGIAIPSLMALVFECAVVYVALARPQEPSARERPAPPPDVVVRERQRELV